MSHPLRHYNPHNQLGSSADFSQYDIVDSPDFTQDKFTMGDFSCYGEEIGDGLAGFGELDEGFGKRGGFKARIAPKAVAKSVPKIAIKAIAKASPVALVNKNLPAPIKKEIEKIKQTVSALPVASQATAMVQQVAKVADKVGIPVSQMIKPLVPAKSSVQDEALPEEAMVETAQEDYSVVSPVQAPSAVVSQGKPLTSESLVAPKAAMKNIHPMVSLHKKIKGEPMSGLWDDLKAQATKLYASQKDKLTQTAMTQATNIVGKTLNKLNVQDPKAQKAISSVVATATTAATTAAQQTALEKAKLALEQNKKYIYMAGAGLAALVAYKMFMKKN